MGRESIHIGITYFDLAGICFYVNSQICWLLSSHVGLPTRMKKVAYEGGSSFISIYLPSFVINLSLLLRSADTSGFRSCMAQAYFWYIYQDNECLHKAPRQTCFFEVVLITHVANNVIFFLFEFLHTVCVGKIVLSHVKKVHVNIVISGIEYGLINLIYF